MHTCNVVIDHTKVSADLTDYVVYVNLAHLPSSFWGTVANGGGDIRVFKSDGTTELAREVVSCDTGTDTGELHIKFSGTLSSSSDTTIQIHADGTSSEPAVTATYGRNAVWSDYARVYHLQETSGAVIDSTGNDDGANNGATTGVVGQMGNAYDFDGASNDFIDGIASVGSVGSNVSFSVWYKADSFNSGTGLRNQIMVNYGGSSDRIILTRSHNSGRMQIDTFDGTARSHGVTTSDTTNRHHFVATTNTSKALTSYLDGTAGASSTYVGGDNPTNGTLRIGRNNNTINGWDGMLDEFRARLSILSADWVSTEYSNQNDPSTFYTVESTGTNTQINIGDTFRDVTEYKLNVGGVWKDVTEVKVNVGGVWKAVM
jgi:hypothetical protein